jgi:hypothetical protein
MIVQREKLTCSEAKKMTKANFNKLWTKIPKEIDEFGTKKMTTITTKTKKNNNNNKDNNSNLK